MNTVLTIIIAILVFGFLILIHEGGHYFFARLFKVKIEEFSVGMGPRVLTRVSKKTGIRYSLSALPIGGYVAMAGEDGESDDPDAFGKKPAWQRLIITAAGATVNIVAGLLAMVIIFTAAPIGSTVVGDFPEDKNGSYSVRTEDSGLRNGDRIVAVGGRRVALYSELSYEIMRRGTEPLDVTVIRDGERITLPGVVFPTTESSGQTFGMIDFRVYPEEKSFGTVVGGACRMSCLIVRMCWESVFDLIRGRYTFEAVSGPIGITSAIGSAAKQGFISLLNITAVISINLGVMNLLPIPALDGGRLFVTLAEIITRKKLPPKVEGTINTVGLMLLLGLTAVVAVKDIIGLFH